MIRRLVIDDLETEAGSVVQDGEPAPPRDFDQTCFLGALAKLRKTTIASSCLSVRMEQLGCHWTDFHEI
jgi:hypothetical protein